MRTVTIFTLLVFLTATSAHAQSSSASDGSHRVMKVLIGAGALVAGATVAATSSKTTTVTTALGTQQTSEFSTTQLVTGLVIAGTGGFLIWDGLRDREPSRPSIRLGLAVGKQGPAVFIRRSW